MFLSYNIWKGARHTMQDLSMYHISQEAGAAFPVTNGISVLYDSTSSGQMKLSAPSTKPRIVETSVTEPLPSQNVQQSTA